MAFEPFTPPAKGWAPPTGGLTHSQARGIGHVVSAWAILEAVLQHTLVTLTQAPLTLGQALTEDLGPDNRLKALKRLCQTWLIGMGDRYPDHSAIVAKVDEVRKWIEGQKGLRNQIAHWQWIRQTDEKVFGFKYTMRVSSDPTTSQAFLTADTKDFTEFGEAINEKTDELIELRNKLDGLPTWPHR